MVIQVLPELFSGGKMKWDFFYQDSMHFYEGVKSEWELVRKHANSKALAVFDDISLNKLKFNQDGYKFCRDLLNLQILWNGIIKAQRLVIINFGYKKRNEEFIIYYTAPAIPPYSGARRREYELLKAIAKNFKVYVYAISNTFDEDKGNQ